VNDETEKAQVGTVVMVEKADLPLRNQESIGEFNEKMDRALTEHFKGLELPKKPRHLWINEVYADRIVACINWFTKEDELHDPSTHYQLSYTRGANGVFTFGGATEVERKTSWTKRAELRKRLADDFWKGAV